MSDFLKSLLKIAVPVTLQCMLQSSFSIVDQLMIGQLGKESIAAVGICGNYALIFSVVTGAVCSVAGILIAQFLGAGDKKEAWSSFHVSLLVCTLISSIFSFALLVPTRTVMGFYTRDGLIIGNGIAYGRLVAPTFLMMGISAMLAAWLRCKEHAVFPLAASFCAVIVNTLLNYVLIFGRFGMPELGIKGAAWATLLSQAMNLILTAAGFLLSNQIEGERIQFSFHLNKVGIREYIMMLLPIMISEFLWSLGQNVEAAVYGRIGTDSIAAYTLTCPVQELMIGALTGLSAAAGVLVGKRLGRKEFDAAYDESKKILLAGCIGAVLLAILLILLSDCYISLYHVEPFVKQEGRSVLIVFALYLPVKVSNMILGGGIIKSGGDTRSIMIIDVAGTWLVGIPLCLFAAYILKKDLVWVYTILTSEEIVRFAVTYLVFKRRKWMNSFS